MGKVYEALTEELQSFIEALHIFFVATAPLSQEGHVNLSPKGHDSLRVLSSNCVAYVDLTGSGNETSAHLHENGRITFMFCAFDGPPQILRLYGTGRTILPDEPEWAEMRAHFTSYPGIRQIIVADITRVYTSCGYTVPFMEYTGERDTWVRWAETKGEEDLVTYRQEKNWYSIDSMPTPLRVKGNQ